MYEGFPERLMYEKEILPADSLASLESIAEAAKQKHGNTVVIMLAKEDKGGKFKGKLVVETLFIPHQVAASTDADLPELLYNGQLFMIPKEGNCFFYVFVARENPSQWHAQQACPDAEQS